MVIIRPRIANARIELVGLLLFSALTGWAAWAHLRHGQAGDAAGWLLLLLLPWVAWSVYFKNTRVTLDASAVSKVDILSRTRRWPRKELARMVVRTAFTPYRGVEVEFLRADGSRMFSVNQTGVADEDIVTFAARSGVPLEASPRRRSP